MKFQLIFFLYFLIIYMAGPSKYVSHLNTFIIWIIIFIINLIININIVALVIYLSMTQVKGNLPLTYCDLFLRIFL